MRRYEITNEQWERIKDLLPQERTGKRGRPGKDNRTMLNGMLWVARSGAKWREVPILLRSLVIGVFPVFEVA